MILRFPVAFWDRNAPYIQTVDERFRILNGHYFDKPNTLVVHCSPPFGQGYAGLEDAQVVDQVLGTLRGMYGAVNVPEPVFTHVTRWHEDPFSMGAYSFWQTGMTLDHVQDYARPEPAPERQGSARISAETPDAWDTDEDQNVTGRRAPYDREALAGADADAYDGGVGSGWVCPRLFFCGEHATIRDAQCVHGACISGERAGRQVAAAALGQFADLAECSRMGEEFWLLEPGDEDEELPQAKDGGSTGSSHPSDASSSRSALTTPEHPGMSGHVPARPTARGPDVLRHPCFSPFPSMACVEWIGKSWKFHCLCGESGLNYDDGAAMIECDRCQVWQHVVCVKLCKKKPCGSGGGRLTGRDSDDSDDDGPHLCRSCAPSAYNFATPMAARDALAKACAALRGSAVQISPDEDDDDEVKPRGLAADMDESSTSSSGSYAWVGQRNAKPPLQTARKLKPS